MGREKRKINRERGKGRKEKKKEEEEEKVVEGVDREGKKTKVYLSPAEV